MSDIGEDILSSMRGPSPFTKEESATFVRLLHKLDKIRLAEVSGYALALAVQKARHTVIGPDAMQYKEAK